VGEFEGRPATTLGASHVTIFTAPLPSLTSGLTSAVVELKPMAQSSSVLVGPMEIWNRVRVERSSSSTASLWAWSRLRRSISKVSAPAGRLVLRMVYTRLPVLSSREMVVLPTVWLPRLATEPKAVSSTV